jgi:DNA polymerase III epsilon subunit-like protein
MEQPTKATAMTEFDLIDIKERGEFHVVDVEGDGGQKPVEISVIHHAHGQIVQEYHWLVNPGRPITSFATGIHGLRDEDVAEAPLFADIADEVRAVIRDTVLVAHGMKDDLIFLRDAIPEVSLLPALRIDTLKFARNILQDIPRHSLDSVIRRLGIALPEGGTDHPIRSNSPMRRSRRHSSSVDAWLTGQAFLAMCGLIPENAKQRRHISQSVVHMVSKQQAAAILAKMESTPVLQGTVPHGF